MKNMHLANSKLTTKFTNKAQKVLKRISHKFTDFKNIIREFVAKKLEFRSELCEKLCAFAVNFLTEFCVSVF